MKFVNFILIKLCKFASVYNVFFSDFINFKVENVFSQQYVVENIIKIYKISFLLFGYLVRSIFFQKPIPFFDKYFSASSAWKSHQSEFLFLLNII